MAELTQGVSWLGVIAGFVASFLAGWLWYSPKLFGKKWADGVGVKMEKAQSLPVAAMLTQAFATFTLAWLFGVTAAANELLTVLLILITVILFIISNGKYAQKSNAAIAIEASYILVMGVIMLVFQGIF